MLGETVHLASSAPTEWRASWAGDKEGRFGGHGVESGDAESVHEPGLVLILAAGSSVWASSAEDEWLWSVRNVREDVKTKAVLGFEAAFVDVLVVVVETRGLQSSRLSLGGVGDFLESLDGLGGTWDLWMELSGEVDLVAVFREPGVEWRGLDIR